ncbi:hypothetical protein SDC9_171279 [bioreactor metagenome]|uniref:Uncharacterized protein n=1 Tax=bioreactor metagenome TaxID=1076179 RepID=A0A645GCM8_9ZZZZ
MCRDSPGGDIGLGIVWCSPGQGVLKIKIAGLLAVQECLLFFCQDIHLNPDSCQISLDGFCDGSLLGILRIVGKGHLAFFAVLLTHTV